MGYLQKLGDDKATAVLQAALNKATPVTLTIRSRDTWLNLRSRLLAIDGERLVLAEPARPDGGRPDELFAGLMVGVSFKYRHYKHIFRTVSLPPRRRTRQEHGPDCVELERPIGMQRVQRRAYVRAAVPEGTVVRVSFWPGGWAVEPPPSAAADAVWSGYAVDLSAGGCRVLTDAGVAEAMGEARTVGLRISFGVGEQVVYADARIRHIAPEGGGILLGLQFLGLEQTREGRNAVVLIAEKAREYGQARRLVGC